VSNYLGSAKMTAIAVLQIACVVLILAATGVIRPRERRWAATARRLVAGVIRLRSPDRSPGHVARHPKRIFVASVDKAVDRFAHCRRRTRRSPT